PAQMGLFHPGRNTIAVACTQRGGGQGVDVGVWLYAQRGDSQTAGGTDGAPTGAPRGLADTRVQAAPGSPATGPAPALEWDGDRPRRGAPYRKTPPVLDGIIQKGEYGSSFPVDFTANSRFGALESGLGDPSQSKSPDDLSVVLQTAYSDTSLF